MRYFRSFIIWTAPLTWVIGCGETGVELAPHPVAQSSVTLFDATPGFPTASELTYRGDWPSAESSYQLGEAIFYQERFIDMQYSSPFGRWSQDRTYRRFSTVRVGSGVR